MSTNTFSVATFKGWPELSAQMQEERVAISSRVILKTYVKVKKLYTIRPLRLGSLPTPEVAFPGFEMVILTSPTLHGSRSNRVNGEGDHGSPSHSGSKDPTLHLNFTPTQ